MLAVYIILGVLAYATTAGFVGGRVNSTGKSKCRKGRYCNADCAHVYAGIFSGVFWPVAIPLTIGLIFGKTTKADKAETRRADELNEANHRLNLAKIREKEHLTIEREYRIATGQATTRCEREHSHVRYGGE